MTHKILRFGAFSMKMSPKKLISMFSMTQFKTRGPEGPEALY